MSSWLSKALGTNSIKMDFNYEPAMASVPGMSFGSIANQMLRGEGSYFDSQREYGARAIQDASAQAVNRQNQAMAMRGYGEGGLRSLLDATSGIQAGEQISNFNQGLAGQGFQMAGQFANMGLQQAMTNQAAQNDAKQYALTSSYNQAAANKAARGQFAGNLISTAASIATGGMGGI